MKTKMKASLRFKKMMLLLLPVAAGLAIALQNVFYNKVSKDVGIMGTVLMIHFFGFLVALVIYIFTKGSFSNLLSNISVIMVLSGVLGVIVVSTITKSVSVNGVLSTVMLSILAQMILAKIIGHFGWFGVEQNPINIYQIIAIFLMFVGVVIYQKN
ncbi:DMT family transporter [Mycoplasmatota bacterium WC30]